MSCFDECESWPPLNEIDYFAVVKRGWRKLKIIYIVNLK